MTDEAAAGTSQTGNLEFSMRFIGDRRYRPGEAIALQVTASARETFEVAFAEAILFFRTEGMGDRSEGAAATVTLVQSGREIMRTLEAPVEFVAPALPFTYYGNMIKVHWMVGIYIQGKGSKVHGLIEIPVIIHAQPEGLEMPEVIPGNGGKPVTVARI